MKLLYTLTALLLLNLTASAQSQRLVLIEEATNASCGPCASQNPAFDALLNQNRDKITAIKYHWYFPGYDPMHNHNPEENNGRVSYYGINGVPTAAIDGDIPNGPTFSYPGGPHGYTQALIDQYYANPSPFEITMSHYLSADEDTIFVNMMILATQAVSTGDLTAHMVVVEKEIHFASPPGANGEKDFLDVMKKMIPDDNGTPITNTWQVGDYIILQGSWALQNIYNMNYLGVVGFIQNDMNKDVHQAANSSSDPLVPLYSKDACVNSISNVPETNCLGTVAPMVTVRNNGSDILTSLSVYYRINDGELQSYEWTGSADFLESIDVMLPEVTFDLMDENELIIYTVNPNGDPDQYTKNDTLIEPFSRSPITPTTIKLMIRTDANPEETTWEVLNSAGETVASGGPYANPNSIVNETIELGDLECYKFLIYDEGGDGLLIPGFYALFFGSNNYIASGTQFGSADSAYFEVNTTVGLSEYNSAIELSVYPNPASDRAKVSFFLEENANVSYVISDLTGNIISETGLGVMQAGPSEILLTTNSLKNGFYMLSIRIGKQSYNKRFIIMHQ